VIIMASEISRAVLLAIRSEFDSKGIDQARQALTDFGKLDRKSLFGALGDGLKAAAGEAFRLLNPLNLVHGLLGTVGGAVNQLGGIFKIALGVVAGTAISTITSSLAQLVQAPVDVAARVEVLENGLRVMAHTAGQSIDFVESKVEDLKKTGITTREAIESVTQFLSNQLPIDNIESLARAAQDMAVVFGQNSSEAFSRFVTTILTGNTELLRAVGIAKTATQMYDEYGATLGKTGEQLDTAERRLAILNGIMQAAAPYAGQYTNALDNVGKKLSSLPRYIEEAQLAIGRGFVPILNASVDVLTDVLKGVTGFFEKHRPVFEGFGDAVADGLRTGWERAKGFLGEISGALLPDFDPQAWFQGGVDLVVNLADGLLTGLSDYVIPAVVSIADTIASFLLGGSPPERGPLTAIVEGGKALINEYLKGFALADFSILDQVGNVIYDALRSAVDLGDLAEEQLVPLFDQVRELTAGLIANFRETGEISEEMLGQIAETLGEGSEALIEYLRLQLEYEKALEDLAAVQEEYAEAEAAGFVPQELKDRLAAAEEAVDAKAEELSWQEAYIKAQQDSVDLMAQQQALMERLAQQVERVAETQRRAAKATEDSTAVTDQLAKAVGEIPQKIDEARQKWADTFSEMFSSFSRLETPLSKLGDFVKGFMGFYGPEQRRYMEEFGGGVSAAYEQGEKARATFDLLIEGIKSLPGKVSEFVHELGRIKSEWWDPLDPAIKNVLLGTIALNFVTGGAAGDILQGLILGAFAAAGLTVTLEAGALMAALYIAITPFLSEEVKSEWAKVWESLKTGNLAEAFGLGAEAAETTLEQTPIFSSLLNWVDSLFAKKPEIEQTTRAAIRDPLILAAEEAHEALVGHSIVPEMVQSVVQWLTTLLVQSVSLLTQLKTQAVTVFTQVKTQVTQLVAGMVKQVLDSLIELRDGSEEILAKTAEIFESMATRIGEAIGGIKDEIAKLLAALDDLIEKANEAYEAMKRAGMLPESPALLALGLMSINEQMGRLHQQLGSVGQDFSDIVPPSLALQQMLTISPTSAVVPAVAAAGGGEIVIQNYFNEGAFSGAFPGVRGGRDVEDFLRTLNDLTLQASARAQVPGGFG